MPFWTPDQAPGWFGGPLDGDRNSSRLISRPSTTPTMTAPASAEHARPEPMNADHWVFQELEAVYEGQSKRVRTAIVVSFGLNVPGIEKGRSGVRKINL
jgi:hypothetical protein